jgi:hypothetical protein
LNLFTRSAGHIGVDPKREGVVQVRTGFFGHEGVLLGRLAAQVCPQVIAAAGHRILLRDMGGRDGHAAAAEETLQLTASSNSSMALMERVPKLVALVRK